MNLHIKRGVCSSIFLLVLTGSAFANKYMVPPTVPGKTYIGILGGGGSTTGFNVTQQGTAFYVEAAGGPLAVNAFGHTNSRSTWFLGAQIGYQAEERPFYYWQWMVSPAAELEGLYFNGRTFTADLGNDTARLPEHDFLVSYHIRRTVFLANAVINFNNPCWMVQPYIGFGIGSAIVRITDADATQVSPPEVGVNHYNSNTSDTDTTFAGQIKLGLNYDINKCVSVFAEYRWLYLGNTHYTFGSTVYAGHPETSPWLVKMDPQRTNLGAVGIRFNIG